MKSTTCRPYLSSVYPASSCCMWRCSACLSPPISLWAHLHVRCPPGPTSKAVYSALLTWPGATRAPLWSVTPTYYIVPRFQGKLVMSLSCSNFSYTSPLPTELNLSCGFHSWSLAVIQPWTCFSKITKSYHCLPVNYNGPHSIHPKHYPFQVLCWVPATMWMLGLEPESYRRASDPKHWAISPASLAFFVFLSKCTIFLTRIRHTSYTHPSCTHAVGWCDVACAVTLSIGP